MIAPDFCRQRVPATEGIAVALVEGARARWRQKDKRGRISWWEMWTLPGGISCLMPWSSPTCCSGL